MLFTNTVRSLLVSLVLLSPVSAAAQMPRLVENALARMEKTEMDDWSYTVTSVREGTKTIERYEATKPKNARWQLLLKNGETPTRDDLAEYDASKNRRGNQKSDREKKEEEDDERVSSMIEPGSLSLISEDSERAHYSFRMKVDDDEDKKFAEHVNGTLVIHKELPHVERLEMQSTGEIKPVIGVKISEFRMVMTFVGDEETGAILPDTISTRIKGRAFVVKSLDEDIKVTFSDYKPSPRVAGSP